MTIPQENHPANAGRRLVVRLLPNTADLDRGRRPDKLVPQRNRLHRRRSPSPAPAPYNARMIVVDLDVWRCAALLTKRHGKDAAIVAAQRADELLDAGDAEGQATWRRIVDAILQWQHVGPLDRERQN